MFKFCPSCASGKIKFDNKNSFRCPDCGFVYYHNTAAATGCLIRVPEPDGDRFLFTVRVREPGKGLMDMPGGFVDPGEGALESLYRELQEELGWTPPVPDGANLTGVFKLYASFPNVYPYKGIKYNTCDLYFTICVPGLTPRDLRLEQDEIAEVRFLKREQIDLEQFAFESTKRAVKAYFAGLPCNQ
jgi:8-oxo-dGTP pyrophosphatase MutT (NUDIX family)